MKWLKRKVIKWVKEDWESPKEMDNGISSRSKGHSADHPDKAPALSFRIYSAQNGDVLEFSKFDDHTCRTDVTIYIVSKETDLGTFISKCVSLELLK